MSPYIGVGVVVRAVGVGVVVRVGVGSARTVVARAVVVALQAATLIHVHQGDASDNVPGCWCRS